MEYGDFVRVTDDANPVGLRGRIATFIGEVSDGHGRFAVIELHARAEYGDLPKLVCGDGSALDVWRIVVPLAHVTLSSTRSRRLARLHATLSS
jgi:hypothetical protein